MQFAAIARDERGFSLPEVLCALALFALILTTLSGYYRALQQGFIAQWQVRQLWRYAREYTEPEVPAIPQRWNVSQQQTFSPGCVSIGVTITDPAGRTGQLTRLHCPAPEPRQE